MTRARLLVGTILTVISLAVGVSACGGNNLGIGETCTDHSECQSGYCNLEAGGSGECDRNDFGAPCNQESDCDGICQAGQVDSADASGYCTRRCDHVKDCSAEPGYVCSGLGPGSADICRRE